MNRGLTISFYSSNVFLFARKNLNCDLLINFCCNYNYSYKPLLFTQEGSDCATDIYNG